MTTATITSKSQITIPAAVRTELHIGPGDRIEFVRISDGRYEVVAATQDVTRLRGVIKANKIVTVEEMNAAIKTRAARK
jgi:AbrB family looped-hinge helix DNA binding protein